MSQTVRDSKDLARHLRRAAQQAKKIVPATSAAKASSDQIAKELLPKLQARGLVS